MPDFSSNDPRTFGWSYPPTDVVPFTYAGHAFPQGMCKRVVPVVTEALDRLCAQPGFQLHTGAGLGDGDWGFEDRSVRGGGGTLSFHAYALAFDVNAPWNAQGLASPPASPYRLPDNVDELWRPLGILWGGSHEFSARPDRMHGEIHLSPDELQPGLPLPPVPPPTSGKPAFPLPAGWYYGWYSGPAASVSGSGRLDAPYRPGLEYAQHRIGAFPDGFYGPATAALTKAWQLRHGLFCDGLIGRLTWNTF